MLSIQKENFYQVIIDMFETYNINKLFDYEISFTKIVNCFIRLYFNFL